MIGVYLFFGVLFLSLVCQIVQSVKNSREVKEMTVSKFKDKVNGFVEKKDGSGLSAFVKRNFIFILRHSNELEEFVRDICGRQPVSVENEKGGESVE